MRFMTDKQRRILATLVRLGGSPLLVEEAFQQVSKQGQQATLDDVVSYIVKHREQWHQARELERYEEESAVVP